MKCLYCRGEMPDNETVCPKCGADLAEELGLDKKDEVTPTTEVSEQVIEGEVVTEESAPVESTQAAPVETPVEEVATPVEQVPVVEETPVTTVEEVKAEVNPTKSSKAGIIALIIILIIVILGVLAVIFVPKYLNGSNNPKPASNNTPITNDDNTESDDKTFDGNMSDAIKEAWERINGTSDDTKDNEDTTTPVDTNNTEGTTDSSTSTTTAFLMPIEDVFTVTGRGTVVTGRIEKGSIKLNDEVQIIGLDKEVKKVKVTGIEMFRKSLDEAEAGDNVGLLLDGVDKDDVLRGQVLATENSIKASKNFKAEITMLTKEEGGRSNLVESGYRPQFYFRTTDITGTITLPENVSTLSPGEYSIITVELVTNVAMEEGTEFSIREGGRTVAKGKVLEVR